MAKKEKNIERKIQGIFLDSLVGNNKEFVIGKVADDMSDASSLNTSIEIVDIIRVKDTGVDKVVDIHSENWPGFNVSLAEVDHTDESAPLLKSVSKLYVPEKRVVGVLYADEPKQDTTVAVTSEE